MINKFLSWNCRGAGSSLTQLHIKDLLETHKPDLLALLEPRIPSDRIKPWLQHVGMDGFLSVEADGYAGGIWVAWNSNQIEVELLAANAQILTAIISQNGQPTCLFSVVYASPHFSFRQQLWNYLHQLGLIINVPWVILGDFNQPISPQDKFGGSPFNWNCAQKLLDTVHDCNLIDLGFQGPQYTWTNCRHGVANIKERIDRGWCNLEWFRKFSGAWLQHLPRAHSDHHPILLGGLSPEPHIRFKGFRFLDTWFHHPEFTTIVAALWTAALGSLSDQMHSLKAGLVSWNTHTFRNIFERKKRCKARLWGVQWVLSTAPSISLTKLETKLSLELNDILIQEEAYWKQKAKCRWHVEGERNTKYFHATVMDRRRKNIITQLKTEDGEWCSDSHNLKQIVRDFFRGLYTCTPTPATTHTNWNFPTLPRNSLRSLNRSITDGEIQLAVAQLGRNKAPGLMAFRWSFTRNFGRRLGTRSFNSSAISFLLVSFLQK